MTTTPYASAYIDPRDSTGQTYGVLPHGLGFQLLTRSQADQIVGALNIAYNTGRAHLQSELRDLIGAAREQETET
jgi:hypothetical protein